MIVGVVGGGQLARMMIPPAVELGIELRVFAESAQESAGLAVTVTGDYHDSELLHRFAADLDVLTFDHEHVPQEVIRSLVAAGVRVRPGPEALIYAQDKLLMRERLAELELPMPDWARIESVDDLARFVEAHHGRAVLKAARGGYDGHGVRVVTAGSDAADWLSEGHALLAEEFIDFRRELSQLIARRPAGEIVLWPVVESIQRDGVCVEVIAPAPASAGRIADIAGDIAVRIAEELDVTGVLAVELFETADGRIQINELAMRPHNTGHWTIDGSTTSQFEQHLRAVLDLPLGSTGCRDPWTVMVNVLGGPGSGSVTDRYALGMGAQPAVKFHAYGKQSRPGRKVGHVTATGDELEETVYRARAASEFFRR